jgi:hypothetical protein
MVYSSVGDIMKNTTKWQKWTKQENETVIQYYGKIKTKDLSKLLPNRTISAIHSRAQKYGLNGNHSFAKKYNVNQNFFDIPNLENSYWAGYLAADGCLSDNSVRLLCEKTDDEILQAFKNSVQATQDIKYIEKQSKNKLCYQALLQIWGVKNWHYNLYKHWNLTPNKRYTLIPPNIINKEQKIAYIIGYFDGDGGIYSFFNNHTYCFGMQFTGTKEIITWIREQIKSFLPDLSWNCKLFKAHPDSESYTTYWKHKKGRIIHEFLRNEINIPFRLNRKWNVDYDNLPPRLNSFMKKQCQLNKE